MSIFDNIRTYFASDPAPIKDGPVLMESAAWGSSRIYGGEDFPEYNPDDLIGRKGYKIYKQMMLDEQVKAVVNFRLNSITGRKHFFRMPSQSDLPPDEAARRINIANNVLDQMPGTFKTYLDGIMSSMYNGFSLTEKVFKHIEIDGATYLGIDSLKTKPVDSFNPYFDKFDTLIKLVQMVDGADQKLDIDNFIHHVNNPNVHHFYGQSEIREAYRAYFSKDITIRFHNMWLERMAAGFVWAQPVNGVSLVRGSAEHSNLASALGSIRNHTALIMPANVELNIEHPSDTQAFERAIAMQDKSIAKALLVPNLLGLSEQGSTGSFAQSKTQLEAFLWDLDAAAMHLEEVVNEQLFRVLGEQNYSDGVYPLFTFRKLSMEQTKDIVSTWKDLVAANVVTSTDEDENLIRNYLDIPERMIEDEIDDDGAVAEPTAPDTALNGAQVTSMLAITTAVADGTLPKDAAVAMIITAYPISKMRAEDIINPIEIKEVSNEQGNEEAFEQGQQGRFGEAGQIDEGGQDQGSQTRSEEDRGQDDQGGIGGTGRSGGQFTHRQDQAVGSRSQNPANQCNHNAHNGGSSSPHVNRYDHTGSSTYDANNRPVKFAQNKHARRVQFSAIDRNATLIHTTYTQDMGERVLAMTTALVADTVDEMNFEDPDMKIINKVRANSSDKRELNAIARRMLMESYELGSRHAKSEVDLARKSLKTKVSFSHIELDAAKFYAAQSFIMAGGVSDKVEAVVRNEIMRGIQHTRSQQQVTQAIYDQLTRDGLIPADEVPAGFFNESLANTITPLYRLENTIRTSTFDAINQGRNDYFTDPILEGFVVAFEYSAIIDGGTTAICNELGNPDTPFIRLVDDPIWDKYRPANHFQCRALLIPLVEGDEYTLSPSDPENEPQSGFG